MTTKILIAGFGGQGVLFAGKFLAYEGMLEGRELSWLPSYGPEMRGGTANCSVILSDEPVGSPIVGDPDILIALNLPSLDKFEQSVAANGHVFIDSSLISRECGRTDVSVHYIPATKMAGENGLDGLANMIMLGFVIRHTGVIPYENVADTIEKLVSAKRAHLIEANKRAVALGYDYEG